jgi:UDP-GlcNAc:undecaprenyl-phosphate/decaprenyl-phosphate GlcNAc-1-phosphate transferase
VEPSQTLIPLLTALATAALVTPLVARIARALGAVDEPTERSVSLRPGIPLLGGLAVAAGTAVGLAFGATSLEGFVATRRLWGFLLGAALVLSLGAWDDRRGLGATVKFSVQAIAALLVVGAGLRIDYVTDPLTGTALMLPPWLGWGVSMLWIVGVTNAINLIDGLDGLATGVGAIICGTLTVIAWQGGHVMGVCLGVGLLGGLLGFLPWNFPPARIFLGDTGSLFIGYGLAVQALEGYRQAALLPFVVPVLALGVPILDTALSIVRRLRLHAPIFSADRLHMHHRLLETRGSIRAAVLQFYFLTACFGLIALSFTRLQGAVAVVCLAAVVLLTLRMLWNLGALSFRERAREAGEGERR